MAGHHGQSRESRFPAMPDQGPPVIFLPGIVMPAELRYAPLLRELDGTVRAVIKDLEVYADATPPEQYSIEIEVEGISRVATDAGFDRFHLYGHSGGGAVALAYAATHPDRALSLALDEPASDFTPEAYATLREDLRNLDQLPPEQRMRGFVQMQLAPGVEPSPPPPGPPPGWMAKRPAGIDAFTGALQRYSLSPDLLRAFDRPVYFSYGGLSARHWRAMCDRLAALLPNFTSELYEEAHHFNTSHIQDPARVTRALREHWQRSV